MASSLLSRAGWPLVGLLGLLPLNFHCADDDAKGAAPTPSASATATATPSASATATATPSATPLPTPTSIADLPADEVLTIPGLSAAVSVVFDGWGVPHIYAQTEEDAVRVQGYLQARDRMFQMDAMRRQPSGTLAAAFGPDAVSEDISNRFLRMRAAAEGAYATLTPDDLLYKLFHAFADGVNHFLATASANELGIEYATLGLSPADIEPWHPIDTFAFTRLQTKALSYDGYVSKLEIREAIDKLGERFGEGDARFGIAADLTQLAPAKPTAIMPAYPDGSSTRAITVPRTPAERLERWRAARPKLRLAPGLIEGAKAAVAEPPRTGAWSFRIGPRGSMGSNNWVVDGAKTANGHALLANDPHLGLDNPSVFYQVHLNYAAPEGEVDWVTGVTFAAAPGVILGHNAFGAWGATTLFTDVTDWYAEEVTPGEDGAPGTVRFNDAQVPIVMREERIVVRVDLSEGRTCDNPEGDLLQEGSVSAWLSAIRQKHPEARAELVDGHCELIVEYPEVPHHGPIASFSEDGTQALSVRWTGLESSQEARAFMNADRSRNQAEFEDAFDAMEVGAQSMVYADVEGNIFHTGQSRVPIRRIDREHPIHLPVPGTGAYEWTGNLEDTHLPHVLNPERGWVATANNDIAGVGADGDPYNEVIESGRPYYGFLWSLGYRAARIQELIEETLSSGGKMDFEGMQSIQNDHRSNTAGDFLPLLFEAIEASQVAESPLAEFDTASVRAAAERLRRWQTLGLHARSGMRNETSAEDQEMAIATSIYNAWLHHFLPYTLGDELRAAGLGMWWQFAFRGFYHLVFREDQLTSPLGGDGHALVYDDLDTAEHVETRDEIILRSLRDGLAQLASDAAFGSEDMNTWLWGQLHTLRLAHISGDPNLAQPHPNNREFPNGYPRHGENFVVDASAQGMNASSPKGTYGYRAGPAIRMVVELDPAGVHGEITIPGGQVSSSLASPHYGDELREYWSQNRTHPMLTREREIVNAAERKIDFMP